MNYEFIEASEQSTTLVNISSDKADFKKLFDYPIWSVSKIRSALTSDTLNLNSDRNEFSKAQLETVCNPFYQKIASTLEQFKLASNKNVLFIDVQFFEHGEIDVILEGEEFCHPLIWNVVKTDYEYSNIKYQIGGAPLGHNLVKNIGHPKDRIHALQINLNERLLRTIVDEIRLSKAIMIFEVRISLASYFCKKII